MATSIGVLESQLRMDTRDYTRGVSEAGRGIEQLQERIRDLDRGIQQHNREVQEFNKKLQESKQASDQASRGLKDLERQLNQMPGPLGTLGRLMKDVTVLMSGPVGLAAATALVGVGLVAMAKSAANTGDELAKLSTRTGVSVETLSSLKLAGELADVSLGTLATGLRNLQRSQSEAASGTKEYADSYKMLGIQVKDASGQLKGTEQILQEVATQLVGLESDADRTRVAMEIFGRSGTEMLPLLQDIANRGYKAIREEAVALGQVWTGEQARAAEAFNDNLTRLQRSIGALALELGRGIIPLLNDLAKVMIEVAKAARQAMEAMNAWVQSEGMKRLKQDADEVATGVQGLIDNLNRMKALADEAAAVRSPGRTQAQDKAIEQQVQELQAFLDLVKVQVEIGTVTQGEYNDRLAQSITNLQAVAGVSPAAAAALDKLRVEQKRLIDQEADKHYKALSLAIKDDQKAAEDAVKAFKDFAAMPFDQLAADAAAAFDDKPLNLWREAGVVAAMDVGGGARDAGAALMIMGESVKLVDTNLNLFTDTSANADAAIKAEQERVEALTAALDVAAGTIEDMVREPMQSFSDTLDEHQRKLRETAQENIAAAILSENAWASFTTAFTAEVTLWGNQFERFAQMGARTASEMHGAFSDSFFALMKGDLDSLADAWEAFFNSLLRMIADFLAASVVQNLLNFVLSLGSGKPFTLSLPSVAGSPTSIISLADLPKSISKLSTSISTMFTPAVGAATIPGVAAAGGVGAVTLTPELVMLGPGGAAGGVAGGGAGMAGASAFLPAATAGAIIAGAVMAAVALNPKTPFEEVFAGGVATGQSTLGVIGAGGEESAVDIILGLDQILDVMERQFEVFDSNGQLTLEALGFIQQTYGESADEMIATLMAMQGTMQAELPRAIGEVINGDGMPLQQIAEQTATTVGQMKQLNELGISSLDQLRGVNSDFDAALNELESIPGIERLGEEQLGTLAMMLSELGLGSLLANQMILEIKQQIEATKDVTDAINELELSPEIIIEIEGGRESGEGLQHGGIVTAPTRRLIGEAGPEAILPLDAAHLAALGHAIARATPDDDEQMDENNRLLKDILTALRRSQVGASRGDRLV